MSRSLFPQWSRQFTSPKARHRRPRSHAGVVRFESLEPRTLLSTWYVESGFSGTPNGSSGAPWITIQAAINAASAGDTILVESGSGYSEADTINKTLTIENDSGENVVDQGPIASSAAFTVGPSVTGVTISGLRIEDFYEGISVAPSATATITGNAITGSSNNGIDAAGSVTIGGTISGAGNTISGNSVGIAAGSGSTATILGNSILGNISLGIVVLGTATIGGTSTGAADIISFTSGDGILAESSATATILGNSITGNSGNGIEVAGGGATIGGTSSGAANTISGNTFDGILVDSSATILGNDISDNSSVEVEDFGSATIGGTSAGAGNTISGDVVGIQVESGTSTILGNTISDCVYGIVVYGSATIGGTSTGAGNTISDGTTDGILVENGGAATITDDSITGNGTGILVGADTATPAW